MDNEEEYTCKKVEMKIKEAEGDSDSLKEDILDKIFLSGTFQP